MLNCGVSIGQYFPGRSFLHRMDPRAKLLLTVLYIALIFIPHNWLSLGLAIVLLILAVAASRLPWTLMWRSVRPILPLVLFTSLINIFYVSTGRAVLNWYFIHITTGGIVTAAFITLRIVCLILGSSLLTYTTSPTDLTDALESVLSPLTKIGVKGVHTLAMMMTIALRFVPTLMDETDKIMSAQKARGADMESGGLMKRIRAMLPVLVPLFVSSFRHAVELATAMECRCYHGGEGRTRMKQMRLSAIDGVAATVSLVFLAGIIVGNVLMTPVI